MKRFIATIFCALMIPQLAQAQIPTIVDTNSPATPGRETPNSTTTAAVSRLEVRCQDLKTVVKKGDRQATMMSWNTNYFGRDFNNKKRCQAVSERLQKAADINGGTFQGLQLASGTVNFQTVICALQNGKKQCDPNNFLFTLKPENASNPDAVIQQLINFAEEGSGMVDESFRPKSKKVDFNLGNWERKNFANSKGKKTGF